MPFGRHAISLSLSSLLAHLLQYGEDRFSRQIARAIVLARQQAPIQTTAQLSEIIRSARPFIRGADGRLRTQSDPSTKTFQAIRVLVNDELTEIQRALDSARDWLRPGGRLFVISFQPAEDTLIKDYLQGKNDDGLPLWRPLPPQPIVPTEEELKDNTRSRSSRGRLAERSYNAARGQRE